MRDSNPRPSDAKSDHEPWNCLPSIKSWSYKARIMKIFVILRVSNFLLAQLRIRIGKKLDLVEGERERERGFSFWDPAQQWVPNCKTGKQNRELVGNTHFLRHTDAFCVTLDAQEVSLDALRGKKTPNAPNLCFQFEKNSVALFTTTLCSFTT